MQFIKPQTENFGGNWQNATKRNLLKVKQIESVLKPEN